MTHPLKDSEYLKRDVATDQLAVIRVQVEELEARLRDLQPAIQRLASLDADLAQLEQAVTALVQKVRQAQIATLLQGIADLEAEVGRLEAEIPTTPGSTVPQPPLQDVRGTLPVGPGAAYPQRSTGVIKRVVVHHTATRADITPQRLAQAQVSTGKAGITYHFLVTGDGTIYWTQPLETAVEQALRGDVNADGIAVALAGNFTDAAPAVAQIESAAALIAWLLGRFQLGAQAVFGRSELESVASPGRQWLQAANYKRTVLERVQAILDQARDPELVIAQLRQQVTGLEAALAAARQENVRLQQAVTQHQAEIENLKRQLQEGAGRWVAKPEMVDVVDSLEKHPTLSPYADRTKAISRIVIHHAASSNQATPQVLARHHVHTNNWPGIGYHFVIAQDGAIYQTQRAKTKSNHVGGEPNNFSVGICLIGRFMLTNADGTPREPKDQVPTPAQMRSVDRLVAWLMQEYNVPIEEVMGHRDVWPQSTVCPGDQWLTGATWKTTLRQRVEAVRAGWDATAGRLMEHYLLLWDHGNQWANADWQSAQKYIAHFRPTVGFSVQDAMLARHVTIVGGEAGVSGIDEARLRAAGVEVHRLAGANEAETKAMLENLVARNTLWPGAPPFKRTALSPVSQGQAIAVASAPVFDPWDVPDERVALAEPAGTRGPVAPRRVKVHPVALPEMPASGPSRRGRRGARRASNQ